MVGGQRGNQGLREEICSMNWSQVHVWLNGAGASLEGWIGVLGAMLGGLIHQMQPPTIQG
jgi:hypothetical protein